MPRPGTEPSPDGAGRGRSNALVAGEVHCFILGVLTSSRTRDRGDPSVAGASILVAGILIRVWQCCPKEGQGMTIVANSNLFKELWYVLGGPGRSGHFRH